MTKEKIIKVNGVSATIDKDVDCLKCKIRRNCTLRWMAKCSSVVGEGNALKPAK